MSTKKKRKNSQYFDPYYDYAKNIQGETQRPKEPMKEVKEKKNNRRPRESFFLDFR